MSNLHVGDCQNLRKDNLEVSKEEKIFHTKVLLRTVLPVLKQFNEEQMMEKEIEAKIQGMWYFSFTSHCHICAYR